MHPQRPRVDAEESLGARESQDLDHAGVHVDHPPVRRRAVEPDGDVIYQGAVPFLGLDGLQPLVLAAEQQGHQLAGRREYGDTLLVHELDAAPPHEVQRPKTSPSMCTGTTTPERWGNAWNSL
jgi:hypothetical protein